MKSAPIMILELLTFDPASDHQSPCNYTMAIVERVEAAWDSGADLVLLPEFTWLGLEPLLRAPGKEPLRVVAEIFWTELLPAIQKRLSRPDKAVILGTVPVITESGSIRNRAPILCNGNLSFQDKLHLTPWESAFEQGEKLRLWKFRDFKIAVIICLDIEIPELSARLRDLEVDLILCPSATETLLGVERVNRCASARSVELGCYVAVSHLTGKADSELIDVNVGCAAFYSPSQSAFQEAPRHAESALHEKGNHALRVKVDKKNLDVARRMHVETNPANLGLKVAGLQRLISIDSCEKI